MSAAAPPSSSSSAAPAAATASSAATPPELTAFVASLRARSIRCVVFDMDRTLVSQHSGGCVAAASVRSFAESLTPAARRLIPHLIDEGIHVAVATFADDLYGLHRDQIAGVELVHHVLRELPCFANATTLAAVPIVTLNPDLYFEPVRMSSEQRRMKSLAPAEAAAAGPPPPSELENFFTSKLHALGLDASHPEWQRCAVFPPPSFKNHHLLLIAVKLQLEVRELILLDDRDDNVEAAIKSGAHGLFLTKKRGLLMQDLHEQNIQGPPQQQ